MKEINEKGFIIVCSSTHSTDFFVSYKGYLDAIRDLRGVTIFNSMKIAQRTVDKISGKLEKHNVILRVEPVSDYISSGYVERNGKVVKEKCFKVNATLYPFYGRKERNWDSYFSDYTIYPTKAECIEDTAQGLKEEIRDAKRELIQQCKIVKELEKQLKKLLR